MSHRSSFDRPTQHFYDRLSRAYDLLANASEHESRERGLELLAPAPGERILEIGFGTGHALVELARAVAPEGRTPGGRTPEGRTPEGEVVGVELSEGMRQVAAERLADAGVVDSVRLLLGDGRALPLRDGLFDAVFLSFTLELFEADEIPKVLGEVRRVLGDGGRLGVVTLASREHTNVVVEVYKWLHRHFPHFIDCQPIPVAELLEEGGFRIEARDELSIWGLPVSAVVARPD